MYDHFEASVRSTQLPLTDQILLGTGRLAACTVHADSIYNWVMTEIARNQSLEVLMLRGLFYLRNAIVKVPGHLFVVIEEIPA